MTLDTIPFHARAGAVALVFEPERVSLLRKRGAGWKPFAGARTDAPDFEATMRYGTARAVRMLAGGALIVTLPAEHVLRRRIDAPTDASARAAAARLLRAELGARAKGLIVAVTADRAGGYAMAAADADTVAEACAHARRWGAAAVCVAGPTAAQGPSAPTPVLPLLVDPPDPARVNRGIVLAWRSGAALGASALAAAAVALWFSAAPPVGGDRPVIPDALTTLTAPTPPAPMDDARPLRMAVDAPSTDPAVAGFTPGGLRWLAPSARAAAVETMPAAPPQRAAAPEAPAAALRQRAAIAAAAPPASGAPPDWGAAGIRPQRLNPSPWITAQAVPNAVTQPHVPVSRPASDTRIEPPFKPAPRAGLADDSGSLDTAEGALEEAAATEETGTPDAAPAPDPDATSAPSVAAEAADAPYRPQRRPDAVVARVQSVAQAGPAFAARPTRRPAIRPAAGVRQAARGPGDAARRATFRTAIVVQGPRLLGVTGGPKTQRALFQASDGAIRRLAEGQSVDGWTVADIDGDRVRMRSSRGAQVLSVPGR